MQGEKCKVVNDIIQDKNASCLLVYVHVYIKCNQFIAAIMKFSNETIVKYAGGYQL